MMNFSVTDFTSIIFSEWFWFGNASYGWKDFENEPGGVTIPQSYDIYFGLALAPFLLLLRTTLERLCVIPIAKKLGVKVRTPYHLSPNPVLENAYQRKSRHRDDKILKELSKKTSMSEREVARWLRKRAQKDVPSAMQKFTECSWHFVFYTSMFIYGMVVLWRKPWFWETKYCWIGWPKQHIDKDVYWYYMIEMGFYWSLTLTVLIDHKRKDFTEMVVHHVVTLLLMYFSYVLNFIRVGTLVLAVHDASDFWMAAAKMAKYCKRQQACEIFFAIFVVVWIISRLVIYPIRVLYTSVVESYVYLGSFFLSHSFFNGLLIILQILHIIWSYMIFRILMQKFKEGSLKKDVRSDSESQESDDLDEKDERDEKKDEKSASEEHETFSSRMTTRSRSKANGTL